MSQDPDLQKRLDTLSGNKKTPRRLTFGITTIALALGLGGATVAYLLSADMRPDPTRLQTSDVEPFQADRQRSGGWLEFPSDETDVTEELITGDSALEVPEQTPAPINKDPDILAELERLRQALATNQSTRNADIQSALQELRAAFKDRTDALQAAVTERDARIRRLESESKTQLKSIQNQLSAERAQREALEAERANNALIRDQKLLEERRRQEAEQQRRDAKRQASELLASQIRSPAVVYTQSNPNGLATGRSGAGRKTANQPLDENETYLQTAAHPLVVDEAARMDRPDRTLAQGTTIQAALQTAINSDLPGNVVAVVTEPVHAFTGTAVLVPRGSRLFGQYRSGLEVNQKRILILWIRILTPDGTSMEIASIGGDPLGRSGLTGLVDTKFDERFGGAALVSIIGAAPAVAASSIEDDTAREVARELGRDLEDATRSVIAEQVSIAPTIYVDQGAMVTVMVDRDIVIN